MFFDPRKRLKKGTTKTPRPNEDLDTIDFSTDNERALGLVEDDVGRGGLPNATVYEIIDEELRGTVRHTPEESERIFESTLNRQQLLDELDDAGIDPNEINNRGIAEFFSGKYGTPPSPQVGATGSTTAKSAAEAAADAERSAGQSRSASESASRTVEGEWNETLKQSPGELVDRPAWELNRAQEAQLHGVPERLISALERVPAVPKEGVPSSGSPRMFPSLSRGLPPASKDEISALKASGFLDEFGNLTEKGLDTVEGRLSRFKKYMESARRGESVPRSVLDDWPEQLGKAYRVHQKAKPVDGVQPKPGADEADVLTVDELKMIEDPEILQDRIFADAARGRQVLDDLAGVSKMREEGITSSTVSLAVSKRIHKAVKDLAEIGDVTLDPSRRVSEYVRELLSSRRISDDQIAEVLEKHNLDWLDFSSAYGLSVSEAAKVLNSISQLRRSMKSVGLSSRKRNKLVERLQRDDLSVTERESIENQLNVDTANPFRPITPKEAEILKANGVDEEIVDGIGYWRRAENIRRGLLVSQIATTMRNVGTQFASLTTAMMNEALATQ